VAKLVRLLPSREPYTGGSISSISLVFCQEHSTIIAYSDYESTNTPHLSLQDRPYTHNRLLPCRRTQCSHHSPKQPMSLLDHSARRVVGVVLHAAAVDLARRCPLRHPPRLRPRHLRPLRRPAMPARSCTKSSDATLAETGHSIATAIIPATAAQTPAIQVCAARMLDIVTAATPAAHNLSRLPMDAAAASPGRLLATACSSSCLPSFYYRS
jgi:hypothetical protein